MGATSTDEQPIRWLLTKRSDAKEDRERGSPAPLIGAAQRSVSRKSPGSDVGWRLLK